MSICWQPPTFLAMVPPLKWQRDYPHEVKRGLRLHAIGNEILSLFGGRAVHPVGACVGGFFSAPDPKAVAAMVEKDRSLYARCRRFNCLDRFTAHGEKTEKFPFHLC